MLQGSLYTLILSEKYVIIILFQGAIYYVWIGHQYAPVKFDYHLNRYGLEIIQQSNVKYVIYARRTIIQNDKSYTRCEAISHIL